MPSTTSRLRFWETRRVVYNLLLAAIFMAWASRFWQYVRPALGLRSIATLGVLALGANVCYCAAYFADAIFEQVFAERTRRVARGAIWIGGTVFAILLENYWIADEIISPLLPAR